MSDSKSPEELVVRTAQLDASEAMHLSHPLNDRSELFMTRLSDRTGLSHVGISLARIPPGRESFTLHVHSVQEEWIYVVSGRGHVRFDDREVPIEVGDFVGFPPGGPAHLVRNTSESDLVYLQGGDRRQGDRGYFPDLKKVGYEDGGKMALIDEDAIEHRPFSDWLAKDG